MSSSAFSKNDLTPAQEEFQDLLSKNTDHGSRAHPEDRDDSDDDAVYSGDDEDEEDRYLRSRIDEAMRVPTTSGDVRLPPAEFDSGCATGVKGVIADARAYEEARAGKWRNRVRAARRSVFGVGDAVKQRSSSNSGESDEDIDGDEETFLQQWREARRKQLEQEVKNGVRNRRTSPSLRKWGVLDTVDALGYLDAIERVGRDTTVVVFVYDDQSEVSSHVEKAIKPLVPTNPYVHFVKVHYEDIEFDNAAVPTILAYKNQGDLVANLTGIVDLVPEDEDFDTDALRRMFQKYGIL